MVFNYCTVPLTFNVIGLSELNADQDLPAMKMMTTVMKIILLLPNQLFAKEFLVITEMDSTQKAVVLNVFAGKEILGAMFCLLAVLICLCGEAQAKSLYKSRAKGGVSNRAIHN